MYRMANAIRRAREHKALVTGEALGQVASQTPENLLAVEAVVPETLVLRPLIGMDKNEIITLAKAIGTYETSILPYQDCCSLFVPKHPVTHGNLKMVERIEADFPVDDMVQKALDGVQVKEFSFPE